MADPLVSIVIRDEFSQALEQVKEKYADLGAQMHMPRLRNEMRATEQAAYRLGNEFGSVLRLTGITGTLVAGSFVASIAAIAHQLRDFSREQLGLHYSARALGTSREVLDQFIARGQALGLSADKARSGIEGMFSVLNDLKTYRENSAAWKQLSESHGGPAFVQDLLNALDTKGLEGAFYRYIEWFRAQKDPAALQELIGMFRMGTSAWADVFAVGKMHDAIQPNVTAMQAFTKAMTDLGTVSGNIGVTIAKSVLPSFTNLIDQLTKFIANNTGENFKKWMDDVAAGFSRINWEDVGKGLRAFGEGFLEVIKAIKAGFEYLNEEVAPKVGGWQNMFEIGLAVAFSGWLLGISDGLASLAGHLVLIPLLYGVLKWSESGDKISGSSGSDKVGGGIGDDTLRGDAGDDRIKPVPTDAQMTSLISLFNPWSAAPAGISGTSSFARGLIPRMAQPRLPQQLAPGMFPRQRNVLEGWVGEQFPQLEHPLNRGATGSWKFVEMQTRAETVDLEELIALNVEQFKDINTVFARNPEFLETLIALAKAWSGSGSGTGGGIWGGGGFRGVGTGGSGPGGNITMGDVQGAVRGGGDTDIQLGPPGQGASKLRSGGGGVHPELADIVAEASKSLPEGYTARIESGREARSRGGQHPLGNAADVRIYGPDGNAVGGSTGWYQNPKTFRLYEQFAQAAKSAQVRKYPNSPGLAWGGYFTNRGPGSYGFADLMHIQRGGPMGGGNWQQGATGINRQWLERGGGVSRGMGQGSGGIDAPGGSGDGNGRSTQAPWNTGVARSLAEQRSSSSGAQLNVKVRAARGSTDVDVKGEGAFKGNTSVSRDMSMEE